MLALASCTDEDAAMQQGVTTQTFNVAISEPDDAPQTKAAATMNRYLLEMYEGDLSAEPVKMESTSGTFNVTMKKEVDYVCLFWADNGENAYDASSLKAVKQTDNTQPGMAAYWARVTVNSTSDGHITLRRAVAKLSFIDKKGLTGTDNTLTITYPYADAVMNLGDGTVEYNTTGTPVVHTLTHLEQPTSSAQPFATDYILAPADAGKLTGLKFKLNDEEEKTIPEAVVQANYKTKITGEYETPLPSMSITIDTRKNTSDTNDATFILPLQGTLSGYSLVVDWGDRNTETFTDGTWLYQNNTTHTYAQAGEYTVTISSTQRDGTQTQMPQLCFSDYSYVNANSKKLVSLNTPLLNMGSNFNNCFRNCTSLTKIPEGLFDNNPSVTNFSSCFYGCTGLTGAIPEALFNANNKVMDFGSCFSGCTGLTGAIPEGLFTANTAVTSFASCFYGCTGLTGTIPEALFAYNEKVTSFYNCFSECTGLTGEIPPKLFEKNTLVTTFASCFSDCTGLEEAIPEGLFTTNQKVTNFSFCFYNCTGLTGEIHEGLFTNNKAVTSFQSCFFGCAGLTGTIPEGLFTTNTAVTTFESCFYKCTGLTGAIPPKLFEKNTAVTTFASCFSGCAGLEGTIPEGLFTTNKSVTNFSACFANCAKLAGTIPQKLFKENTAVTNFESCFAGCTGLTGIPQGLFDSNTLVTDFNHCFSKCTGLTGAIPTGLFDKNTLVTNFSYCFNECTGLTEAIPTGLFDKNTLVTTFYYCFYMCTKLTGKIPTGLFAQNKDATIFESCFYQCFYLIPTANIFCDETTDEGKEMETRFAGKTMNFKNCFNSCGLKQERQGTLPQLWTYTMASSDHTMCFAGTSATNTSSVPDNWK